MRPRRILVAAAVIAAAAVCVRLGYWQLERLGLKRRLNAERAAALRLPPIVTDDPRRLPDVTPWRRVELRGVYDERRQVLLAGRSHDETQGVHVVTPLRMAGGSIAVLVDRGWLPAADAVTARPQDLPAPGPRIVLGIADTLARGASESLTRTLEADTVTVYSTFRLDHDALAARFPYPLARFSVAELPAPGAPPWPLRERPQPLDEMMHLSYAVQWFTFATILLLGPAALAWSRRRAALRSAAPPPGEAA